MTTIVQCPTCKVDVPWINEQKHRPFCSDRCQLIDFGGWATESFRVAGEPSFDEASLDAEDLDS